MRLAALSLCILVAGCATKAPLPVPPTPPAPVSPAAKSNPAWAYPSPDGCEASWWLSKSGTWQDWQFGCTGVSAMHGPWGDVLSRGGATWTAKAWSNSASAWVTVYSGSVLADAEAAVVAYLGGAK
jgi:hypothetical protein